MSSQSEIDVQLKLQVTYPWIQNSLFEEILCTDFENVDVKNYVLNAALAKGENYGSQMIRATVNYTSNSIDKEINLIIKTVAPTIDYDQKMDAEMKEIFMKEITVYHEVLPKVIKLFKKIGDDTKLHPRCYATSIQHSYIIFEDLSAIGFKNVNRRDGLDVAHYKKVLNIVAKYHAATAVLIEEDPTVKSLFTESVTATAGSFFKKMITNFLIAQREFCKTQPGLEKLVEKFTHLEKVVYDKVCKACLRDENDFNILLHGDLWSNNIMYKYDANGDVEDTVLVDFQICYYGPPALDVSYNLYTSSHMDVSETDWENLIQYYYDILKTTLIRFDYSKKIPSLMQFHTQIIMRGFYGAIISVCGVGARHLENVGDDGMDNFLNDDAADYRLNMLLHPKVVPNIIKLMKFFDRRGYYEI